MAIDPRTENGCFLRGGGLSDVRAVLLRGVGLILASILVSSLTGCGEEIDPATSSKTALEHSVEPEQSSSGAAPPPQQSSGAVSEDAEPKTASRSSADPSEPEDTVGSGTPVFVLEASRDLRSLDIKALQAGQLRVPSLLLTADISKVPLREVLADLASEIGAKIYVAETVPDEGISVKFERLPVEEGIERILKGRNYTLVRKKLQLPAVSGAQKGSEGGEELMVAEIRVVSQDPKVASQPAELKEVNGVSPKRAAQVEALAKKALEAETPRERLAALQRFLKHADSSQLTATLVRALEDKDSPVRELALNSIGDGEDTPLKPIADIALMDESPKLRISAMEVLVSKHGAQAIPTLEQAASDPNPRVRKAAKDTLGVLQLIERRMEEGSLENENIEN